MTLEYKKAYERECKDDKSYCWKRKYSPKKLKALNCEPLKSETKSLSDEKRSDIKQPPQIEELKLNEVPKPLCIKLPRKDFDLLIKDVVNNLENAD